MTFSVDVDFWPFQAGPPQDATARADTGNGRGKDFASSLLGVSADTASSVDLPVAARDDIPLAPLSLLNALPVASPETQDTSASIPFEDRASLSVPAGPGVPINQNVPKPQEGIETEPAPEAEVVEVAEVTGPISTKDAPQSADTGMLAVMRPAVEAPPADLAVHHTAMLKVDAADETSRQEAAPAADTAPPMATPANLVATPAPAAATTSDKPGIEVVSALAGTPAITLKTPAPPPTESTLPDRRSVAASPAASLPGSLPAEMLTDLADPPSHAIGTAGAEPEQNGNSGTDTPAPPATPSPALVGGVVPQGQSSTQPTGNLVTAQLTPAHAMLTATATQLPDIVARATSDGQDDRIMVQLDPPELGRVSIDFKFDAQGLQHVTITAESPEAMRQLRLMHFELVQALERNGLTGQNMSFQHQNPQQNEGWGDTAKLAGTRFDTPALTGTGLMIAADSNPNRQIASSGRLDIRL
ncbi:MAG: flagellar hook-length control protein FliK [Hyphomonas sp.]